jgi:hypothetical protein
MCLCNSWSEGIVRCVALECERGDADDGLILAYKSYKSYERLLYVITSGL